MMPVNPPAASASRITAGNQNRLNKVLLCSTGVLMIAFGEYFEAIDYLFPQVNLPESLLTDNVASHRKYGQVE